jgi:uncharacterized membrane protein
VEVREAGEIVETAQQARRVPGQWGGSRLLAGWLVVAGVIGLIMSGVIMYDKIQLMQDSSFVPSCTINDVVSCTDVMNSDQASAFGFPNPFIGLVGFGIVLCIGMALFAGATFRNWFWYIFLAGLVLAVVFVHWLAYEAVYSIQALCPYCMVVWTVTLPLFLSVLLHVNAERRSDALAAAGTAGTAGTEGTVPASSRIMPVIVLVVWYLAFLVLILEQFVWS